MDDPDPTLPTRNPDGQEVPVIVSTTTSQLAPTLILGLNPTLIISLTLTLTLTSQGV